VLKQKEEIFTFGMEYPARIKMNGFQDLVLFFDPEYVILNAR
jgi:hypothetical protein